MSFEPQKFFIGIVDFFSILMPCGLLVYAGTYLISPQTFHAIFAFREPSHWMVFLFAAYLLGNFAFLFGSVLDDWFYDPLRKCTYRGQIARLAKGEELSGLAARRLANSFLVFRDRADLAVMQAERIKARALHALQAGDAINSFQWCKARLGKDHPEGSAAVLRFEANSKFFRSLVIVLAVLFVLLLLRPQVCLAALCLLGLVLSLWRYIVERFKATEQAFWQIVTLQAAGTISPESLRLPRKEGEATHAGGVVFRVVEGVVHYLLIQSRDGQNWVLPQGHIEAGERPAETAVREVKEESGYWARVTGSLGTVTFNEGAPNKKVVAFYCMEACPDPDTEEKAEVWRDRERAKFEWREPERRQHDWLPLDDAKSKATFPDTRHLLDEAETCIRMTGRMRAPQP